MPLTGTQVQVQVIQNNLYKQPKTFVVVERTANLEATVQAIGPDVTGVAVNDIVLFPYTAEYAAHGATAFIIPRSIIVDVETPL